MQTVFFRNRNFVYKNFTIIYYNNFIYNLIKEADMLKISNKLKVYLYTAFILTGVCVLLLTLAILLDYNAGVNYFNSSLSFSVFRALCIITVVWFFSAFFLIPKKQLNGDTPLTTVTIFPSSLFAVIMLSTGLVALAAGLKTEPVLKLFRGLKSDKPTIILICGLLALISVVYFIMNCFPPKGKSREKHALVGFSVPLSAAMLVAVSYFDVTVSMNAPSKLMFHFSLILFMLWSLYELRAMLGKPMPRCYFVFGLTAMLLSASASLPWMIAFFAGKVAAPVYPTYLIYNVVSFGVFVYTAVRLTVFVNARSLLERIADQTPPEEPETEKPEEETSNNSEGTDNDNEK